MVLPFDLFVNRMLEHGSTFTNKPLIECIWIKCFAQPCIRIICILIDSTITIRTYCRNHLLCSNKAGVRIFEVQIKKVILY